LLNKNVRIKAYNEKIIRITEIVNISRIIDSTIGYTISFFYYLLSLTRFSRKKDNLSFIS